MHYLQTEEPITAISRASYLGPAGMGTMALGPDLQEVVNLLIQPGEEEMERLYYRDSDTNSEPLEHPREQWEELVEEILVFTHLVEFARFGRPVDARVPSEDEILPEHPGH